VTSKEVIKKLTEAGWKLDRIKGSHHTFTKTGVPYVLTVPHPEKDVATGTLKTLLKLI
jgi:Predicted periplasmic or secreted lipoprotein